MQKIPFNEQWEFTLGSGLDAYDRFGFLKYSEAGGAAAPFYDHSNWEHIDLPHDWAVALPKHPDADPTYGLRANTHWHRYTLEGHANMDKVENVGWYRKQFFLNREWENERIFLEFEGVFRDSVVWVNGVYIDRHTSGYTGFTYEITDHLLFGEENSVAVRVDSEQHEGWWYEGAGIYRNVWLLVGEPTYFKCDQTVIKTDMDGTVAVSAVLVNDTAEAVSDTVTWTVKDREGTVVAQNEAHFDIPAYSEQTLKTVLRIQNPALWHVDSPNLYTLSIRAIDETEEVFGIREIAFDANRGFLLNGKPLKIHGACVHQDLGGVGVALTDNLQYYKIKMLKEMGVNAYRCSHHAPAPALLQACDELGMLVMDETRMFGTSPEALRQLQSLVERDRNHPCVFIWCVGNEEFSVQNKVWSYRLMAKVSRLMRQWDDTRPCTYAGNNGDNYIGANGAAEIRGINYIRNGANGYWLDKYHREHPDQPIIGTEESSYVLSRGGSENDLGRGSLDYTGTVTMPWGSTPKGWVKYFEMRPYLAGSFMWTGFDYRGEPNPFVYSNHSSSFGAIDLCGIPKPPFYYYRAWWTDAPVLRLAPHWNYTDNEETTVSVYTNCPEITLALNGRKIGTYTVEAFNVLSVKIPFEKGVLRAEGKTKDGTACMAELRTSEAAERVCVESVLKGKTRGDISILELRAVDRNGVFCPLADLPVELSLPEGKIIGVGNGDPADFGYEQKKPREVCKYLRLFQNAEQVYSVPQKSFNTIAYRKDVLIREEKSEGFEDDFRLVAKYSKKLSEPETANFVAHVSGLAGYRYLEFERIGADVSVYIDGNRVGGNQRNPRPASPYRFYYDFGEGEHEILVEATLDNGNRVPFSGYVKVGKEVCSPWQVRLHYGLARVFVKSETPEALKAVLLQNDQTVE